MGIMNHAQFYQLHAMYPEDVRENIELGCIEITHPSGRNHLLDTKGYFYSGPKVVAYFETLKDTKEIQHKEFDYNITEEDILSGDCVIEVYTGEEMQPVSLTLDVVIDGKKHPIAALSHLKVEELA